MSVVLLETLVDSKTNWIFSFHSENSINCENEAHFGSPYNASLPVDALHAVGWD
jgi:hypothetical protein